MLGDAQRFGELPELRQCPTIAHYVQLQSWKLIEQQAQTLNDVARPLLPLLTTCDD